MVDDRAVPVIGGQSCKDIAEQLCRIGELAGNILGLLVGIPVVDSPLIAPRWGAIRPIYPAGREHPFALYEQHVPQVAAVLQGRPQARLPPGSQVSLAGAQDGCHFGDPIPDILFHCFRPTEVVDESAVRALVRHPAIVIPHCVFLQTFHAPPTFAAAATPLRTRQIPRIPVGYARMHRSGGGLFYGGRR